MNSQYKPYKTFEQWSLGHIEQSPKFVEKAMSVLEKLKEHSKKNPGVKFKAQKISNATGYKQINGIMRWLRLRGFPICSDANGYWYSDHPDDIQFTIDQLQDRIYAMQFAIDKLWSIK